MLMFFSFEFLSLATKIRFPFLLWYVVLLTIFTNTALSLLHHDFFSSLYVRPSISSNEKLERESNEKRKKNNLFLIQFTSRECIESFRMRLYK